MIPEKNPCYGCKERTSTCHATCEKGLDFDKRNKAYNEEQYQKRLLQSKLNDYDYVNRITRNYIG